MVNKISVNKNILNAFFVLNGFVGSFVSGVVKITNKLLNASHKPWVMYVLGLCCVFASPPIYFLPVLLVCIPVMFYVCDSEKSPLRAALLCGLFFHAYFLANLHWVAVSLTVQPGMMALAPIILLLMPALPAVPYAVIFYALIISIRKTNITSPWLKYFLFASVLFLMEFVRSNFYFSGFPWQTLGVSFSFSVVSLQIINKIKLVGVDLIASFLVMVPYLLFAKAKRPYIAIIIAVCVCFGVGIFGVNRLNNNPTKLTQKLVLGVQGNIDQSIVANHALGAKVFWRYNKILQQASMNPKYADAYNPFYTTLFVLPESAVVIYGDYNEKEIVRKFTKWMGKNSVGMFTGAYLDTSTGNGYNRATIFNSRNEIVGQYDKRRLVPFGEYMPFRSLIPKSIKQMTGIVDMKAGEGKPQTMYASYDLRVSPAICYEAIFSNDVVDNNEKPDVIVNMVNDGWFGKSLGPYQHFALAQMRAAEEGIPLVRVSNNGISAILDGCGRILQYIPLNTFGILYGFIPERCEN